MTDNAIRLVIPKHLQRSASKDPGNAAASARSLLHDLATRFGLADLGGARVLDLGCGVKFSEALINDGLPIGRYVGIDVYAPVIDFLREAVDDERFGYAVFDAHNARYNPDGTPIGEETALPIEGEQFDIICAYSLFTHLEPSDFSAMLRLARPHLAPEGRGMCFTTFLDQRSPGGHGLMDHYSRAFGEDISGRVDRYQDFTEGDVLRQTVYTEAYARELVHEAGWTVVDIEDPTRWAQHMFVVRPT